MENCHYIPTPGVPSPLVSVEPADVGLLAAEGVEGWAGAAVGVLGGIGGGRAGRGGGADIPGERFRWAFDKVGGSMLCVSYNLLVYF